MSKIKVSKEFQFQIGDVPIYGNLILAPMDGITDLPFRGLCRKLGSAMCVTEFINALDVLEHNQRYQKRIAFEPDQRPLSLQLLGSHPDQMLRAAEKLIPKVRPDIIDINLGCQSKNVTSRGAGAALMKTPEVIAAIFNAFTHQYPIPISGKIRLGWDQDQMNYLEVAKIIQDNGGAMVAVHGRTRKQTYKGHANWEPIREIKQALQIPVIGNGDVCTLEDIHAIKDAAGCDAVMIGRAAVGNPWIFSGMDRKDVPVPLLRGTILDHLESMLNFYGERGIITFRKYLKAYLTPYSIPREALLELLRSRNPGFVRSFITTLFNRIEFFSQS